MTVAAGNLGGHRFGGHQLADSGLPLRSPTASADTRNGSVSAALVPAVVLPYVWKVISQYSSRHAPNHEESTARSQAARDASAFTRLTAMSVSFRSAACSSSSV